MGLTKNHYRVKRPKAEKAQIVGQGETSLHTALQASYNDKEADKAIEKLERMGYIHDIELSNRETKIFYHPTKKKLLTTVRGTQGTGFGHALSITNSLINPFKFNPVHAVKEGFALLTDPIGNFEVLRDAATDVALAVGDLKHTRRYKSAKTILEKGRSKYNPTDVAIVGHSLGGSIASGIGRESDHIYTYNKGAGLDLQKLLYKKKGRKNEVALRTPFDVVSGLSAFDSNSTSLMDHPSYFTVLGAHGFDLLRDKGFTV